MSVGVKVNLISGHVSIEVSRIHSPDSFHKELFKTRLSFIFETEFGEKDLKSQMEEPNINKSVLTESYEQPYLIKK